MIADETGPTGGEDTPEGKRPEEKRPTSFFDLHNERFPDAPMVRPLRSSRRRSWESIQAELCRKAMDEWSRRELEADGLDVPGSERGGECRTQRQAEAGRLAREEVIDLVEAAELRAREYTDQQTSNVIAEAAEAIRELSKRGRGQ